MQIKEDHTKITIKHSRQRISTSSSSSSTDDDQPANPIKSSKKSSLENIFDAQSYSKLETAILAAKKPLEIKDPELITFNGESVLWCNKDDSLNWKGNVPITEYKLNDDPEPEIIVKKNNQEVVYEQEIGIRYLRPPTPPPLGEIILRQEKNIPTPPAPPLVIRQVPARPVTPSPLVIREAPPRVPEQVEPKIITISGKKLPPPPRRVVIERLAPLPTKPQSIIIERWLPYVERKRKVIFTKPNEPDPVIAKPKNLIIQWEPPSVVIKKSFKDLGIIKANPADYVAKYGDTLRSHEELPQFVRDIRPPIGLTLAAEQLTQSLPELEGDLEALSLIDLDENGLADYKGFLKHKSEIVINIESKSQKQI
jgi:hypothetical protein